MPPNRNASEAIGSDAPTTSPRYARPLSSLPRMIESDEIGVTASRSKVCFSRSWLIEPGRVGRRKRDDDQRLDEHDARRRCRARR